MRVSDPSQSAASKRIRTALTLGVEEEYLLVDAMTKRPRPVGALIVQTLSDVDFQRELSVAQAESATPVCTDLESVGRELVRGRHTLADAARDHGTLIIASGTPPTGRPGPPPVTTSRAISAWSSITALSW